MYALVCRQEVEHGKVTREAILTAAAELMRRQGLRRRRHERHRGGVGRPDRLAVPPLSAGQSADRRGRRWSTPGVAYGLLIPTLVDPHDDLGEAIESVFAQAAEDMASTGFANMCPVASVAAEIADTVEELRATSAAVFNGWLDGGTAYFVARGLPNRTRATSRHLDRRALEGAFVLARTLRSTEPLLSAGRVLAPQYKESP